MEKYMIDVLRRIKEDIKNYYKAVILLLILNIVVRKTFHAFCPFLIVTGLPCPGCGLTRAVLCILHGEFARGMHLNPAAPFWMILIGYFMINRYLLGKKKYGIYGVAAITCIATVVIYSYRMLHFFPGDPPLVFDRNNLLSKYVTFYNALLQYLIQM